MQYHCTPLLYNFTAMKLLTLIWALYLVALSLAPCSDAVNNCEDNAIVEQTDNHDHNKDQDDNCTPFCHCACCSINIAVYNFSLEEALRTPEYFVEKKTIFRDISHTADYYGNIWQPPKAML